MNKAIIMTMDRNNNLIQFLVLIVIENLHQIVQKNIKKFVVNQKHQRKYIIQQNKDKMLFKVRKNNYLRKVK